MMETKCRIQFTLAYDTSARYVRAMCRLREAQKLAIVLTSHTVILTFAEYFVCFNLCRLEYFVP